MTVNATPAALIAAASAPYRAAGYFAYWFARGKLKNDPAFVEVLARGLLVNCTRILDLGCGQGLLAAWLLAARSCHASGIWPTQWPPAPQPRSFLGIELMERDVKRARRALGNRAEIVKGDVREVDYPDADAIVILDVLHYMDYESQERVLARVRSAVAPGGVMLLRVGDAEGGFGFTMGKVVDRTATFLRGHRLPQLYCRPVRVWCDLLSRSGFRTAAVPMSAGTPFANVLLIAQPT